MPRALPADARESWRSGTAIEATTSTEPILDALARQERMLAPRTTERFLFGGGAVSAAPAPRPYDLALLSVMPLATPTALVPLTGLAFARACNLALIALQPLVAPTASAMHLPAVVQIPHQRAPTVATGPAPESRAYRSFTELATWLGMTQEESAALLGVGRTTPLAWRRGHEPQPARARRLFQTHALVKTLVRRLGVEEARRWLERGSPSPLELIRAGDVATADDRADALIFGTSGTSRLDAWRDEDVAAASPGSDSAPPPPPRRVRRQAPRPR